MKPIAHLILIPGVVGLMCLSGCMPKPRVLPEGTAEPDTRPVIKHSAADSGSRFGTFNLQKRHGLGGWSQQSGPSEQELLRTMSASPATTPAPAAQ